jgi:membrane protein DedA with SNARE-associated domain
VFAPATAVAAVLWAALYFFAGALLQATWQNAIAALATELDDIAAIAVLLILLAVGASALVRHWRTRQPSDHAARG